MTPTPQQIIAAVSERTGISVAEIMGDRRSKGIAHARGIAAVLMASLTQMSNTEIGNAVNRERFAILHYLRVPSCVEAADKIRAELWPKRTAMDSSQVIAAINADPKVRREVIAHLTPAIIGQIVAAHSASA
jgi:hypothetical protein